MNGYFESRRGLGDIPVHLRQRPCRIAYFGASVTAQRDGYRPRLHEWLVGSSGQPHQAINAALGGVGAVSAVFSMDDLVLRHRPDLCLIEYSSGDTETQSPAAQLGPAVEGIVRKLLDVGCQPVLVHLYRHDRRFDPPEAVISTYERVAEHYGLPSIHAGRHIEAALLSGARRREDLFRDGIHTTEAGAVWTTDLIAAALAAMLEPTKRVQSCLEAPRPEPLLARNYQRTAMAAALPAMLLHPARCESGRLRFFYPYVQIEAENAFECSFDSELVGLVVVLGPTSGGIRIRTPRGEIEKTLWDEQCYYDRYGTVVFDPPLPPGATVIVEHVDVPLDYARCARPLENAGAIRQNLRLIGFMLRS